MPTNMTSPILGLDRFCALIQGLKWSVANSMEDWVCIRFNDRGA